MVAMFERPFDSLIPAKAHVPRGIQMGEVVSSWPELLHRYSFMPSVLNSSGTTVNPWDPDLAALDPIPRFPRILRSFQFMSGSVRFKVVLNGLETQNYRLWASNITDTEDSLLLHTVDRGATFINKERDTIEAQIPFYSKYNMVGGRFPQELDYLPQFAFQIEFTDTTSNLNRTDYYVLVAAGDDFTLGWVVPPMALTAPMALKKTTPGGKLPSLKTETPLSLSQSKTAPTPRNVQRTGSRATD
jgi:hypothetical protein